MKPPDEVQYQVDLTTLDDGKVAWRLNAFIGSRMEAITYGIAPDEKEATKRGTQAARRDKAERSAANRTKTISLRI